MATLRRDYEILIKELEITGIGPAVAKGRKTTRLLGVDLVWPRAMLAKKSAAKELTIVDGKADLKGAGWTDRILFRETCEDHFGFSVTLTEILDDEWIEKFLRTTLKFALKEISSCVQTVTAGIGDAATSPIDALANLAGTYPGPKTDASGVFDVYGLHLPAAGGSNIITVPLRKSRRGKTVAKLVLEIRGL
jgi:hypothetical protein